jgi:hypothetical protein
MLATAVTASFVYPTLNAAGQYKDAPVRFALVDIEAVTPVLGMVKLNTTPIYTDANGQINYSVTGLSPSPNGGPLSADKDLFFRVYPVSDPNRPAGQYQVVDADLKPYIFTTVYVPGTLSGIPLNAAINVADPFNTFLNAVDPQNTSAAFSVFDDLGTASTYGDTLAQESPQNIADRFHGSELTVQYPGPAPDPSYFSVGEKEGGIDIPEKKAYSYGAIAHEYGHYMADMAQVPESGCEWRALDGAQFA